MTSTAPPDTALPRLSAHTLTLLDSDDLKVRIGHLAFWDEGVEFTLELRLHSDTDTTPRVVTTFFDVAHDGDIPFTLSLHIPATGAYLNSQSKDQQSGGHSLVPSGGTSTYGPTPNARFDSKFWLSPRPQGPIDFEVECAQIGLAPTKGSIDFNTIPDA